MKTLALLAAVFLAVTLSVYLHPLRLGHDLIFYSDDVAEFTLPNGKPVRTNRWYDQDQLLAGRQEFYLSGHHLGIIDPEAQGLAVTAEDAEEFAVITGDGEARGYLAVVETHTTVTDPQLASTPAGEQAVRAGLFDEYWVRRLDAEEEPTAPLAAGR